PPSFAGAAAPAARPRSRPAPLAQSLGRPGKPNIGLCAQGANPAGGAAGPMSARPEPSSSGATTGAWPQHAWPVHPQQSGWSSSVQLAPPQQPGWSSSDWPAPGQHTWPFSDGQSLPEKYGWSFSDKRAEGPGARRRRSGWDCGAPQTWTGGGGESAGNDWGCKKPADWICPNCSDLQYGKNEVCRICGTLRPPGAAEGECGWARADRDQAQGTAPKKKERHLPRVRGGRKVQAQKRREEEARQRAQERGLAGAPQTPPPPRAPGSRACRLGAFTMRTASLLPSRLLRGGAAAGQSRAPVTPPLPSTRARRQHRADPERHARPPPPPGDPGAWRGAPAEPAAQPVPTSEPGACPGPPGDLGAGAGHGATTAGPEPPVCIEASPSKTYDDDLEPLTTSGSCLTSTGESLASGLSPHLEWRNNKKQDVHEYSWSDWSYPNTIHTEMSDDKRKKEKDDELLCKLREIRKRVEEANNAAAQNAEKATIAKAVGIRPPLPPPPPPPARVPERRAPNSSNRADSVQTTHSLNASSTDPTSQHAVKEPRRAWTYPTRKDAIVFPKAGPKDTSVPQSYTRPESAGVEPWPVHYNVAVQTLNEATSKEYASAPGAEGGQGQGEGRPSGGTSEGELSRAEPLKSFSKAASLVYNGSAWMISKAGKGESLQQVASGSLAQFPNESQPGGIFFQTRSQEAHSQEGIKEHAQVLKEKRHNKDKASHDKKGKKEKLDKKEKKEKTTKRKKRTADEHEGREEKEKEKRHRSRSAATSGRRGVSPLTPHLNPTSGQATAKASTQQATPQVQSHADSPAADVLDGALPSSAGPSGVSVPPAGLVPASSCDAEQSSSHEVRQPAVADMAKQRDRSGSKASQSRCASRSARSTRAAQSQGRGKDTRSGEANDLVSSDGELHGHGPGSDGADEAASA
ncbi:unnamed protein product, partial [Prorocentrum cordatum]